MDDKKVDGEAERLAKARAKRRQRVRALILGSLASGGAFQLNGWQAQAHGNRSSKSAIGEFQDVVRVRPISISPAERQRIAAKRARTVAVTPQAAAKAKPPKS